MMRWREFILWAILLVLNAVLWIILMPPTNYGCLWQPTTCIQPWRR